MDIGTEELSHLEIVGTLARMHLAPMKFEREEAEADPLIAIAGGGGVNLFNSKGNAWTADYLKITGELDVDLRSNIAAEARAKIVYERLINFCDDAGTKDALQFLMTREITHMKAFAAALESMGKPRFSIGQIAPTAGWSISSSTIRPDEGDHGEIDARGPWNEGDQWEFVEAPAFQEVRETVTDSPHPRRKFRAGGWGNDPGAAGRPAARHPACGEAGAEGASQDGEGGPLGAAAALFETHLEETEAQVERLNECFGSSASSRARSPARA